MNYAALFGVICFNIIIGLGAIIAIISLVASLWITVASFLLSPILLFIVIQLHLQEFQLYNVITSFLLFTIAALIIPWTQKLTRFTYRLLAGYVAYNKRIIFH